MGKEINDEDLGKGSINRDFKPLWLSLLLVLVVAGSIAAYQVLVDKAFKNRQSMTPFLQVKNRDFSIFLFQNPQFMRANTKEKTGYLPGFREDNVRLDPIHADDYVVVSPRVLFRYHVSNSLLGKDVPDRPILVQDFRDFLATLEEWLPRYWEDAPEKYQSLITKLGDLPGDQDLRKQPEEVLPRKVRQAFFGWKNYFEEGEKINQLASSRSEMEAFLRDYPQFGSNYWGNILQKHYPNYSELMDDLPQVIPARALPPFVRVALFNQREARAGR